MLYHLVPLGCQMNQSDAERIRAVIEEMGYRWTDDEREADLLGVVACSVRQRAIDKVYSRIHRWNEWKRERAILTFVSGCILPADREKFLDRFDLLFTINELPQVPDMIRQHGIVTPLAAGAGGAGASTGHATTARPDAVAVISDSPRLFTPSLPGAPVPGTPVPGPAGPHGVDEDIRDGFWKVRPRYSSTFDAYVPIQNGCDKFCTFCAVPYTRGREVSRPSVEILAEIERLVDSGYRSITLLGQNVNSYGLDRRSEEVSFAQLLDGIGRATAGADVWVYFTSPHPRDMTDDVLETIARYPTIAKQIHLPLQSGDDKVLIRMNRNYRLATYRRVVESVRTILPTATLFTDIIVGFTGETIEQFERTRSAMEEFAYNMAYIAMYSPRPGAASARWADDVPQEEKKRRLRELTEVLQRTGMAANRSLVGSTTRILVDGHDRADGYLSGRTEGRIPVRLPAEPGIEIGSFVEARITDCRPLSLAASSPAA